MSTQNLCSNTSGSSCCQKKDVLVVIPARFGSTRLPGKMLADIANKPLIVHTWMSVTSSSLIKDIADVVVACDDQRIFDAIKEAGGEAVFTSSDLPSGTDRTFAAYKALGKSDQYSAIINVQGDMPFVESKIVLEAIKLIKDYPDYDMSTVGTITKTTRQEMYELEQVVNPVVAFRKDQDCEKNAAAGEGSEGVGEALYFSRSPIPFGGPFYKHIGVYGFRPETLERFVSLPQSSLEKSERLEQLRAIENGMKIGIKILDLGYPISVDTAEDLENARAVAANFVR